MIERRVFLKSAVAAAAAAIPFQAFLARAAEPTHKGGLRRGQTAGYGPLFETADQTTGLPLLMLPEGFKYLSFGWRGDMMSNGQPTPSAHDGMAAFDVGSGRTRLVRNAGGRPRGGGAIGAVRPPRCTDRTPAPRFTRFDRPID